MAIQKQYVIPVSCEIPKDINHKTLEFHTILFEPTYIPEEVVNLGGYWRLSGVEQNIKNMNIVIASVTGSPITPSVKFDNNDVQAIFVGRNMSEIKVVKNGDFYGVRIKTFYINFNGELRTMPIFSFDGNIFEIRKTLENASISSFIPAVEACIEKFDKPNKLLYYQ